MMNSEKETPLSVVYGSSLYETCRYRNKSALEVAEELAALITKGERVIIHPVVTEALMQYNVFFNAVNSLNTRSNKMNAQTNTNVVPPIQTVSFAVAELGAMKATVDSLAYSRNKTEQGKSAKLVVSFLSQMARVRGGKALSNIKLVGYTTEYTLEGDELNYIFQYVDVPVVPAKAKITDSEL